MADMTWHHNGEAEDDAGLLHSQQWAKNMLCHALMHEDTVLCSVLQAQAGSLTALSPVNPLLRSVVIAMAY